MNDNTIIHLSYNTVKSRLAELLTRQGFTEIKANRLAQTFADNSLEGVATHGLNRFPRFVESVRAGQVLVDKEPVCLRQLGAIEQWDGQLGAGILNAFEATDRAMALADDQGLACVALANTNHWMRGGTYGWHAARRGYIFIGWTNTIANMPPWGGIDIKLGNNPLVLAVPYQDEAIVLDMAQSQFSYGAMQAAQLEQRWLPFPGGHDKAGELTRDPEAVLASGRALPAGYWKGAGLALMLDILVTMLSGGRSTAEVTRLGAEYGVSQVFMAIHTDKLGEKRGLETQLEAIINDYLESEPIAADASVRYPGESALHHRRINEREGVPVHASVWEAISNL